MNLLSLLLKVKREEEPLLIQEEVGEIKSPLKKSTTQPSIQSSNLDLRLQLAIEDSNRARERIKELEGQVAKLKHKNKQVKKELLEKSSELQAESIEHSYLKGKIFSLTGEKF